ncbi:acyl-CoA reductase-like NAD-dependent aldehyde dehydrogenase [Pusillimonas noertemannii]|uniref:Acyl-CoA reductase-like NAD-dependent aldehyde dehydrogenase n=2 Tax=Pusillimonas noertemannii TaxID=305977 RepID=A0A2U1CL16_9BURK|nr:acyl-CoA reductase-like NAD-dependent aldehyde dehydrogenase [Pusillimonas noertemannii]
MPSHPTSPQTIVEHMLIDGKRVEGNDRLEVRNPARPSEIVGTIVRGTPAHVEAAVAAAKRAQPQWAALSFRRRAALLERGLRRLEEDLEQRAAIFVRENGKPLAQARGELQSVPVRQRQALGFAEQLDEVQHVPAQNGFTFVTGRPYGVVVSIVPWNSPDVLAFTQVVAALLAGNGVVLKPPESCPLTLIDSIRRFSAELPAGIVNIVTGLPGEIGDVLTTHPDVAKLGFTGSIPAARHIMANAAQTIKGVTLELGGNDPAIVLEDAVLDEAVVSRMTNATFMMSGQVCMAAKRFYVHESRADEFLAKFRKSIDSLVVGNGLEPSVTLGPVHSQAGLARARELVDDAVRRGGHVEALGRILDRGIYDEGYFMQPTLVTNLPDDARLVQEEQFCPAIPVATFSDDEEAIRRANSTIFGLGGSVWSKNTKHATDVALQLESGQVWINSHGVLAINHLAPYGGVKQSGIGRKSGLQGILEYLHSQTITSYEDAATGAP